jgi:small subunit ribosomal protein S2
MKLPWTPSSVSLPAMASSLATTSRCTLSSICRRSAYRGISSTAVTNPDEDGPTPFEVARRKSAMRSVTLEHFGDLGSTQTRETSFRPHKPRLDPIKARELTVSHLLASTAHVGHSVSSLSRANVPMLYGTRHGQAIIDVEKYTLPALKRACKVVRDIVYRDGVVIFLGTAPGTERCILQAAKRLGPNGYHITNVRWIPGVLTNATNLLSLAILGDMEKYEDQVYNQGRYKEPDAITLATQDLQPDLLIVLNPKDNVYAIREATAVGVPTIGVTDTDVDPRIVTYAIPANDESIRTTELVAGLLSKAGEEGAADRRRKQDELDKKRRSGTPRNRA